MRPLSMSPAFAVKPHGLIPLAVLDPFADQGKVVALPARPVACEALPEITLRNVMATVMECFAEALVAFNEGAGILWLYFRYCLAALRRDIASGLRSKAQSLAAAYAVGGAGWGMAIGLAVVLAWR